MIYKELTIIPPRKVYTRFKTHMINHVTEIDKIVEQYGVIRATPHAHTPEAERTYDVMVQYPLPKQEEVIMACNKPTKPTKKKGK